MDKQLIEQALREEAAKTPGYSDAIVDDESVQFFGRALARIDAKREEVMAEAKPVAWAYTVNNAHSILCQQKPPEDAYDKGSLSALYSAPQPPAPCPKCAKQPPCTNEHVAEGCEQFPETAGQEAHRTIAGLYAKNAILLLRNAELQAKVEQITETDNTAHLVQRVEQFDRAITRIGHYVGAVCAGVDTEDEHGPGGHTAVAIIEKFDALQDELAVQNGMLKIARAERDALQAKVAEQSAEIERLKTYIKWLEDRRDESGYLVAQQAEHIAELESRIARLIASI